VLGLWWVEFFGSVTFLATFASVLFGLARRHRPDGPVQVVARRDPPRWTETAWIFGTFVAIFWPVGVLLLPGFGYHWPAFPDFPNSWIVQFLGALLGIAGGWLFARAARALGTQMTPAIRVQEGHQLVQTGPYRLIRHPVYTAILTIALGQTLLFLSPLAALLAVSLLVLAEYRARIEEDLLRSSEAFGPTYDAYVARTGRFLPWPRGRSRPP
jgi:protein-S-isoprenylcysteine O-methyltransferase Ste14